MWDHMGVIATLILLVVNVSTVVFAVLQRFAMQRMEIEITKIEKTFAAAIVTSEHNTDDKVERVRREIGESISAIRLKVTEVELYCRDTYVRRDSFFHVSNEIKANVADWGSKIEAKLLQMEGKNEARLERMEKKIDEKT